MFFCYATKVRKNNRKAKYYEKNVYLASPKLLPFGKAKTLLLRKS